MPLPKLDIFEKMRGIYSPVTDIRRRVIVEVAKMIVTNLPAEYIETIPYNIITQNTPTYRDCVFKERAIVRERVRLAFGMDLKEFGAHDPILDTELQLAMSSEKVLKKPIVNVIKIGCERCPTTSYWVTDMCRGCIAHPCTSVCPKNCVSIIDGRSHIDQEKCIKCGKCAQVCPYNAIVYRERPCAEACGVNAIISDKEGFAEINYDKCVSCGLCIVSCPFGAIAEKSEIVQILHSLKSRDTYAIIAPSFVGQFGPLATPDLIIEGICQLGFKGVYEVAYGADLSVLSETEEILDLMNKKKESDMANVEVDINSEKTFVGTSCCPSWVLAAKKNYPELSQNISDSYTPMVETAKLIKNENPNSKVVMIGPCIAKKMECFHPKVEKFVDFVMTYEELSAIFVAQSLDITKLDSSSDCNWDDKASELGRGFPVAGGVANAVKTQVSNKLGKEIDFPFVTVDTLENCLDVLKKMKQGRLDPFPLLVEGMACPYGCIGGPGTLAPINRAKREVNKFKKQAKMKLPSDLHKETK